MDRRNFIKINAALTTGLLLPNAVMSQSNNCVKSIYYGSISNTKQGERWSLTGKLCEKATANFETVGDDAKIFDLEVIFYAKGTSLADAQKGNYKFEIKDVKTNSQTKTATCKLKLMSVDKNQYTFPRKMFNAKGITLTIITSGDKRIISIKSRKGELGTISRTVSSSSGSKSDCYLTTACLQNKGLADNCMELETLRSLREGYMKKSFEGKQLLKNYDAYAPRLVEKINSFKNSVEVYSHMYQHMICPSVALIQQGRKKEAMNLYKQFSAALYGKYFSQS